MDSLCHGNVGISSLLLVAENLCPPPNWAQSIGPQNDISVALFLWSVPGAECEQQVSRCAAKPRVTGVDEHHASRDDGPCAVK